MRRYCFENQLQCCELRKVDDDDDDNNNNNNNNNNIMYLNVVVNDQQ